MLLIYSTFLNYKNNFRKGGLPKLNIKPTDNSGVIFNDNEPRHLPKGLTLHPSVKWFKSPIMNKLR